MTPGQLMTELAACLCAQLTPDGADGPEMCFCGIQAGDSVDINIGECRNDSECAMAWVRLDASYPAIQIGEIQVDDGTCGAYLGMDIEIGILRCVPTVDDDGQSVEPEVLNDLALAQIDDMALMRRAVACCGALEDVDYLLGVYTPFGPEGLILGGTWMLSVLV